MSIGGIENPEESRSWQSGDWVRTSILFILSMTVLSLKGLWDTQGKVFGTEKLAGATNSRCLQWALEIVK